MRRQMLIAGVLILVTLLLSALGLLRYAWRLAAPVAEPWQVDHAHEPPPDFVAEVEDLRDRVTTLSVENVELRQRLQQYAEIRGEGRVRPEALVVARSRIVARSNRQGRRYVELDAGALDGVRPGMAVVAGWSLVGVVRAVDSGHCVVQLITDAESRIPARLYRPVAEGLGGTVQAGELLAEGLLAGSGAHDRMELRYIEDFGGPRIAPGLANELQAEEARPDSAFSVEPGYIVVTAGTDGRLPPDLVLGSVTSASRSPASDLWEISVAPRRLLHSLPTLQILRYARAVPAEPEPLDPLLPPTGRGGDEAAPSDAGP